MSVRLEGWNHIPEGYGAVFDVQAAPWWLRCWLRIPFLDRFGYPMLVKRGLGYLRPHPGEPAEGREEIGEGWRLAPADHQPPGSITDLR